MVDKCIILLKSGDRIRVDKWQLEKAFEVEQDVPGFIKYDSYFMVNLGEIQAIYPELADMGRHNEVKRLGNS